MASASGSSTNRPSTRGAGGDTAHSGAAAQPLAGGSPSLPPANRPNTRGAETNTQLPPLPYGASADLKKVQASLDRMGGSGTKVERVDGEGSVWDNYTYNAERVLGSGAFGIVYQARIVETGDLVAIKKVLQDARFKNRELEIMQELKHPNIVELKHAFHVPGDKPRENYLNVVMEYCTETVHGIMKHHTKTRQLVPHVFVQLYTYQQLRGVAYMHAMNICHRDIKPPNLLVNSETHELKICDFGSAKRLSHGEPNVAYICSRYYRAPELIFGATQYSTLIDMWSVACVTAELILQQVLFPGDSGVDQLMEIIKVLGTPTRDDLESMNPVYGEFKFPQIKSYPWNKIFRSRTSPEAVDWLSRVLQYNPKARPTGLQACTHPLFDDLRNHNTRLPHSQKQLPDSMFWFSDEELDLMDESMKQKLIPTWIAFRQGGKWPMDLGVTRRHATESTRMSLPTHEHLPLLEVPEKRPASTREGRNRDGSSTNRGSGGSNTQREAGGEAGASGDRLEYRPDPLANLGTHPSQEDERAAGHTAPASSPPASPLPEVGENKPREKRRKKKKERLEDAGDAPPANLEVPDGTGEARERASPRQKKSKRHRKRDADAAAAADDAPTLVEADVVNYTKVEERRRRSAEHRLSSRDDLASLVSASPRPEDEEPQTALSSRRSARGSQDVQEPHRVKSKQRPHADDASAVSQGPSETLPKNSSAIDSRSFSPAAP